MIKRIKSKDFRVPLGKHGEPQPVADVIDRGPQLGPRAAHVQQAIGDHGSDLRGHPQLDMEREMKVYLARHGETEWSVTSQPPGLTDLPLPAIQRWNER